MADRLKLTEIQTAHVIGILRTYMRDHHVRAAELSRRSLCSDKFVSEVLRSGACTLMGAQRLAAGLKMDLDYLLGNEIKENDVDRNVNSQSILTLGEKAHLPKEQGSHVAEVVEQYKITHGITTDRLAGMCQCSTSYIRSLLNSRSCTLWGAKRVAEGLNMSLGAVTGTDVPSPAADLHSEKKAHIQLLESIDKKMSRLIELWSK